MRITQTVKFPTLVRAYVAEPRLPLANMAMPRTQVAMDLAARLRLPPARLVQFRIFLQYFQVLHGMRSPNSIIRLNPTARFRSTLATPQLPAHRAALYLDDTVSRAALGRREPPADDETHSAHRVFLRRSLPAARPHRARAIRKSHRKNA